MSTNTEDPKCTCLANHLFYTILTIGVGLVFFCIYHVGKVEGQKELSRTKIDQQLNDKENPCVFNFSRGAGK